MTLAQAASRQFERLTRAHAPLLACACVTILSISLASPDNFAPLDWKTENSLANEFKFDAKLQAAAAAALGQREGTIIVMDPKTGRVRAIVNSELAFARAVMPGSTMKPFTALAALRSGLIDVNSRAVCPGRFTGLSFSLSCVHANHLPPFAPSQALAYSCNYYFGALGERLGRDKLIETLRQFGFGQATGIAEKEDAGTLRPCETGNRARIRPSERDRTSPQSDCEAREALGESDYVQVTPIQLLTAYTALVNGGHLFQPQVVGANEFHPFERARLTVAPEHHAIITEGLRGAVHFGTARSARLDAPPLSIFGKTGTSRPAKGFHPNGWFVGFAGPARNLPSGSSEADGKTDSSAIDLAVLVFLSHSHGSEAAAVSKSIFETYAEALEETDGESGRRGETASKITSGDLSLSASPRPPVALSSVRVHLVHDNLTLDLGLEEYVLGVMRAEDTMETEPEALKALAVAIRTYALKNRGRHAKDGYDFCSTTHCQRFLAARSPNVSEGSGALPDPRISVAVKATEGQVLTGGRGQLIDAYFSASCGGATANLGALWGANPPAYLRGVRDEYCLAGPHANWTDVIPRTDLLRALHSDARTDVGSRLDNVVVSKQDETGRAEFITLAGEHRKIVRGWDFKIIVGRVLGWNLLKSSRFEIARAGSHFVFHGRGFGHGLGLCQEGAHVMAQRGTNYTRILAKYFPGTGIAKINQVTASVSWNESWNLTAEDAKAPAKSAKENLCVPLRNPLPPLRLNTVFSNHSNRTWTQKALSSENFRLTYPVNLDRQDADLVLRILENARADYLHRASAASISIGELPSLEIHLNDSTGNFIARTGQPWWAAAATRGNKIELQPAGVLKRRGVLTTTLRHELAHVVIDAASHNRAPRWLEEGFAIFLAGEGALISRYATGKNLNTEQLERSLERPSSAQEMRALYASAYRSVSGLIQSEGEAGVWRRLAGS